MSCLVFTAICVVIVSRIKNPVNRQTTKTKYSIKNSNRNSFTQEPESNFINENDSASNLSDLVFNNNQDLNLKFNPNNFNANEFYTSTCIKLIFFLFKNNRTKF